MRLVEFELGFEQHDELNPRLWDGDHLLPEVKRSLLKIAEDFREFVEVPFDVIDATITGGQVSYFYTKHSDLDLHLIVDFSKIACDREVAELFDSKRLLYKNRFNIAVRGIPVEVYVEDLNMPAVSASYSIIKDTWEKIPKREFPELDTDEVLRMSAVWEEIIRHSLTSNDAETAKKTLSLLRNYRKLGLKKTGEYGTANLVYKTLRNSDLIQQLVNLIDQAHDQHLSIK